MSQHITERRSAVLREIFDRSPELGRALDIARGPCLKFQGRHSSRRKCKKGDSCPLLHVKAGQELQLAANRLRAPFLHLTSDNKLLLIPPLKQALVYWWQHTMQQDTRCPITSADVLREGDSMVVSCTLQKGGATAVARDSVGKSWVKTPDGDTITASSVQIPGDRTWWHATNIDSFGAIL